MNGGPWRSWRAQALVVAVVGATAVGGSSLRPPLPLPRTPLIGRERELMSAHVITVPRRFTGRISC